MSKIKRVIDHPDVKAIDEKHQLRMRVRELEKAMPNPFTLLRIATTMKQEILDVEDAGRLIAMADRIAAAMKMRTKQPEEN